MIQDAIHELRKSDSEVSSISQTDDNKGSVSDGSYTAGWEADVKQENAKLTDSRAASIVAADPSLATLAPETRRIADFFLPKRYRRLRDLDTVATQPSVFDDPKLAPHYAPPEQWENYKNWDPKLRWTWREEAEVVKKIDRNVLAACCLCFAILNLDRNNSSAANSDGILKDLGLSTDDFNLSQTLFRVCFLAAELPGQVISKRIGPDVFVPIQMLAWGTITFAQMWITNKTGYLLCRALLGLCQGSVIPDLLLLLSYFYRTSELPMRLCWFWVTMNATSFFSSFLSYGFLAMRGVDTGVGAQGWRWLFCWEGVLTIILGVWAFTVLPASPSHTKRLWSKKPFLNERQTKIAVARVLRNEPQKSTMHIRQGLNFRHVVKTAANWRLWPIYWVGVTFGIPLAPIQQYLTLSLRGLGFSVLETQVLSSVQYAIAIFTGIAVVVASELFNDRAFICSAEDVWALPFLSAIFQLSRTGGAKPWTYYGLATTLLAAPYVHPIQAAWVSANAGDVQTRTVAASLYNIAVQLSAVISSQIYRADDAPRYIRGNTILVTICAFNILTYIAIKIFYRRLNAGRAKKWDAMSPEQKSEYLSTTKDEGNERLDFRFIH